MFVAKKVIAVDLSVDSLQNAINALESYRDTLDDKCIELREKIAQKLTGDAQAGFDGAVVDDIISGGGARLANVTVNWEHNGDGATVVIAQGDDAVWVEFGAGVYHNGAVGSSPNPYGAELGFTIGSFGRNGARATWGFSEGGSLILTHGTPASMPLFHAVQELLPDIAEMAREVFG